MKSTQFYIATALSALCLILSIWVIALGKSNQHLQQELQSQQNDINRGTASQQAGSMILKEMGQAAVTDDKMKEVLAKNGFTLTVNPPAKSGTSSPSTSPSSSPHP